MDGHANKIISALNQLNEIWGAKFYWRGENLGVVRIPIQKIIRSRIDRYMDTAHPLKSQQTYTILLKSTFSQFHNLFISMTEDGRALVISASGPVTGVKEFQPTLESTDIEDTPICVNLNDKVPEYAVYFDSEYIQGRESPAAICKLEIGSENGDSRFWYLVYTLFMCLLVGLVLIIKYDPSILYRILLNERRGSMPSNVWYSDDDLQRALNDM